MDRGALVAIVLGVAKSQTPIELRLNDKTLKETEHLFTCLMTRYFCILCPCLQERLHIMSVFEILGIFLGSRNMAVPGIIPSQATWPLAPEGGRGFHFMGNWNL